VTSTGEIVTNNHVVEGATSIAVTIADPVVMARRRVSAKLIARLARRIERLAVLRRLVDAYAGRREELPAERRQALAASAEAALRR